MLHRDDDNLAHIAVARVVALQSLGIVARSTVVGSQLVALPVLVDDVSEACCRTYQPRYVCEVAAVLEVFSSMEMGFGPA